jgi:hypothetical protein
MALDDIARAIEIVLRVAGAPATASDFKWTPLAVT